MEVLGWIAAVILLIILSIILYQVLRRTTRLVQQEERLIIYRLGRFHRIAGPGMVQVIPGLERVKQLEVRDHPVEVPIPGVLAFGVLNDLTLNVWCRVDLAQAAARDKNKLAQLVQLSDWERRQQVEVKMREVIMNQIADLQRQMPLPNADTFTRIMALTPGSDHYKTLIEGVKHELEQTLPSVGVFLNTAHPIVLTKRNISDKIVEAIVRGQGRDIDSRWLTKYAQELRQQFPDMSNAVLAQILSSIEGVDTAKVQRLLLEQEAMQASEFEYEMREDRMGGPNTVLKPTPRTTETAAKRPPASSAGGRASGPPPPQGLTKSDLAVLKRVPRGNGDQRLSA